MNDNIKRLVEDAVSSYFDNISWSEIVGYAVLENIRGNTPSEISFVSKLVDSISEALEDNVSGDKIIDEIVDRLEKNILTYQQTPSIEGRSGMVCSKCYRPNGVWGSKSGNTVSDQSVMVNGKNIIMVDDL